MKSFPLETERLQWQQRFDSVLAAAKVGGGFGPGIGEDMDLSHLVTVRGTPIARDGRVMLLAGSITCRECIDMLNRFQYLSDNGSVRAVFVTQGVSEDEIGRIGEYIDVVLETQTTPLALSGVGTILPTLFLIEDGLVVLRADAGIMSNAETTEALERFVQGGAVNVAREILEPGRTPETSIHMRDIDGATHSFPSAFARGTHLLYVYDPLCSACEISVHGLVSMVSDNEIAVPWIVVPAQMEDRDAVVIQLQSAYPHARIGWIEKPEGQQDTSSHPLSQWSQVLTPGTLIFRNGVFITSVLTVINHWLSTPDVADASIYVEAAELILGCVASNDTAITECTPAER